MFTTGHINILRELYLKSFFFLKNFSYFRLQGLIHGFLGFELG